MGDKKVAPKILRKMLDLSSKQAYRLIEEKITKKGIKPSIIPYERIVSYGRADGKEIWLSDIAKYLIHTLPTKKSDLERERKRIIIQEDTLKKLREILGNGI